MSANREISAVHSSPVPGTGKTDGPFYQSSQAWVEVFKCVPRGVAGSLEWTSSKSPYFDSLFKLQQFFPLLTTNSWLLNCFKVRKITSECLCQQTTLVYMLSHLCCLSHICTCFVFPPNSQSQDCPGVAEGRIWSGQSLWWEPESTTWLSKA